MGLEDKMDSGRKKGIKISVFSSCDFYVRGHNTLRFKCGITEAITSFMNFGRNFRIEPIRNDVLATKI